MEDVLSFIHSFIHSYMYTHIYIRTFTEKTNTYVNSHFYCRCVQDVLSLLLQKVVNQIVGASVKYAMQKRSSVLLTCSVIRRRRFLYHHYLVVVLFDCLSESIGGPPKIVHVRQCRVKNFVAKHSIVVYCISVRLLAFRCGALYKISNINSSSWIFIGASRSILLYSIKTYILCAEM